MRWRVKVVKVDAEMQGPSSVAQAARDSYFRLEPLDPAKQGGDPYAVEPGNEPVFDKPTWKDEATENLERVALRDCPFHARSAWDCLRQGCAKRHGDECEKRQAMLALDWAEEDEE